MWRLNKIAEIFVGNRATIRHGFNSGLFTGFPVTILVVFYFAFIQDINLPEISSFQALVPKSIFGILFAIFCLSLIFIFSGGTAIGWLLTRPLATVLCKLFPDAEYTFIWALSNAIVWSSIVFLTTQPLQYQTGFLQWVSFAIILILTLVSSAVGGRLGARVSTGWSIDYREQWVSNGFEQIVIGGIVTGSLFFIAQSFVSIISLGDTPTPQLVSSTITFCAGLAFLSIICMLPYIFITPLLSVIPIRGHSMLAYSLTSAVFWVLVGIVFFGTSMGVDFLGSLISILVTGLCGACGGWAIGQLKQDTMYAVT